VEDKMSRGERIGKSEVFIGVHMDKEVFAMMEAKIKETGVTKRDYFKKLVEKDLGLEYIPGHYKKANE